MRANVALAPGASDRQNEDWAGVTPHVAVVLDGLSSMPGAASPCSHGTPWFVGHLGAQLLATALDPSISLHAALAESIRRVAALHPECDATAEGAPSATVALIRERVDFAIDYLVLADARVVLQAGDGSIQVITDERVDEIAKGAQAAALSAPIGSAEQRRAVAELIATQKPLRNRPMGYWVASGDPDAAEYAFSGCIERSTIAAVALLSDGASRIVDLFGQMTWPAAFDAMQSADGPREIIRRVRSAESTDPRGHRWPRYKATDDAAIVYLTWD